jgi:hypothetical protein
MPPLEYSTKDQSLGLPNGPCDFDENTIKKTVEAKKAGNFAIGYIAPIGGFAPKIIGGSDEDVQKELLKRIEVTKQKGYDKFVFKYATSVEERFERECINYHTFHRQLDNKVHPFPPEGTDYSCPDTICAQFFKSGKISQP